MVYVVADGSDVLGVFSTLQGAQDWAAEWRCAVATLGGARERIIPFPLDGRRSERACNAFGVALRGGEVVKTWTAPVLVEGGHTAQVWREGEDVCGFSSRGFGHALQLTHALRDSVLTPARA